jgi:hypothetical protein
MKVYIENAKKSGSAPAPSKRDKGKRDANSAAMYNFSRRHREKHDGDLEPSADQYREMDEGNINAIILNQRQDDLNVIERFMNEVNHLAQDMAVEVESADAKLDVIGQNARETKENTKKALVDVAKGAEYQSKSYGRMYLSL